MLSSRTERQSVYISEMSISNMHGGGLTVQHVLGNSLKRFSFIHLGNKTKKFSYVGELNNKVWYIYPPFHRPSKKNIFKYLFYLSERKLLRKKYKSNYRAVQIANEIFKKYSSEMNKFLIVPQTEASVYICNAMFGIKPFDYTTWVMDDHCLTYDKEISFVYREEGFEEEMLFHLQHAKGVFVISHAMQAFYKKRFNVESKVLFNPCYGINPPVYQSTNDQKIRLSYFGALMLWQRDALEKLALRLEGANATLDIYTHYDFPKELKRKNIFQRQPILNEQVPTVMRQYDAVVLPIGFHESVRHLSELNYSTKMSEYLASGIPTLAIGPTYAAMIEFLKKHNSAYIVDNPNDDEQWKRLNLLKDSSYRKTIIDNAFKTVMSEASVSIMRQHWNTVWDEI